MAGCTDYLYADKVLVVRDFGDLSHIYCTTGLDSSETYGTQGDYCYTDYYDGGKGLKYSDGQYDRRYRNIEIHDSTGTFYDMYLYFARSKGQISDGLAYAYVRRDTDLEHDGGTTRLYEGDRVFFGEPQAYTRGSGTGRSWIRCWGYSRGTGAVQETYGGYVLDPYSNSVSYWRLTRQ